MTQTVNLRIFNTPVEAALRVLVLLVEAYPKQLDIQRLLYFDYLLVHSKDAGGPESLHPPTPHRAEELLIRRELIEQSLYLLLSRGLVERHYTSDGIVYIANDIAGSFVSSLRTPYSSRLRKYAQWVEDRFDMESNDSLQHFFQSNMDSWGGEFALSALTMDEVVS